MSRHHEPSAQKAEGFHTTKANVEADVETHSQPGFRAGLEPPTFACTLGGVPVGVSCQPESAHSLRALWRQLFTLGEAVPEAGVRLHFGARPLTPPDGEEVYHAPPLRIQKTARGFFLACGASALDLFLSEGVGTGYLDETFFSRSVYHQREFFLLSLLMLLRPRGLYGLHANGLVDERGGVEGGAEKSGVLIIGQSGSGKTALTLSLVRAGWRYGSDDATLLRDGEGGVEARAFRHGFSCTDETVARFPELKAAPLLYHAQGKRVLDISAAFPDRFAPSCRPRLLLFPKVTPREDSQLLPMSQTDALVALMQGSAGIMTDKAVSKVQLEVLKKLVEGSSAYRVLSGRDVLGRPQAVSKLLQAALQAQQGHKAQHHKAQHHKAQHHNSQHHE